MKKVHILLVEDDPVQLKWIKEILMEILPEGRIVGEATSIEEARKILLKNPPAIDLAFLDINLGDGSAFDLLNCLPVIRFNIVFTTSHPEFALKAIKVNALDYIVKPFLKRDFEDAINKYLFLNPRVLSTNKQNVPRKNQDEKLSIPGPEGFSYITIQTILYCQSNVNYTQFHLLNGRKIVSSKTLKEYASILEPYRFFRIHQSYLINLSHVERFIRTKSALVELKTGVQLPVSQSRRTLFIELFGKTL